MQQQSIAHRGAMSHGEPTGWVNRARVQSNGVLQRATSRGNRVHVRSNMVLYIKRQRHGVLYIVRQPTGCGGIAHMHQRGTVHREATDWVWLSRAYAATGYAASRGNVRWLATNCRISRARTQQRGTVHREANRLEVPRFAPTWDYT